MKAPSVKTVRCAIYTRVSTEHGLDQEFNSLDAQYDAASAYIKSQAHAGWTIRRPNGAGSLRRSDSIRNNCSARPRSRIPGAKRGRTSRSSPTAGNGIFRCGDRAPKTATKMRERRQRPKSGN